jgi:GTP cyclohydrolase II
MGLSNGHGPRALSIAIHEAAGPDAVLALASARGTGATGSRDVREASRPEQGGLSLTRLARLLPAIVGVTVSAPFATEVRASIGRRSILEVPATQIAALVADARVEVTHVSDGPVPLQDAEDAHFVSFREANGVLEHVAILIGDRRQWPAPVPVRIHSACLTGDLFGSLRCDCGEQLRGSLRVFGQHGGGVLLYMAHEGRGIGFGNKLRAYTLQQQGLDTVDADCTLGFGADERRYDAAVEMLRHLGIERIQLLTNNPDKVRAVREGGIDVTGRQPLYGTLNRHNLRYVTAKVDRAGHWLGEMLSGAVPGK